MYFLAFPVVTSLPELQLVLLQLNFKKLQIRLCSDLIACANKRRLHYECCGNH